MVSVVLLGFDYYTTVLKRKKSSLSEVSLKHMGRLGKTKQKKQGKQKLTSCSFTNTILVRKLIKRLRAQTCEQGLK